MSKLFSRILLTGLTLLVVGCNSNTSTPDITKQAPGFLPNYSLLKPVASPKGMKMYVYKNPKVSRGDYNAAIVEPVKLYQTATDKGVTDEQISQARDNINAGIKQIVSSKLQLTNEPGPHVLRLNVAITGASVNEEGFKPYNIIPISAAIKLASMATGNDSKTPSLVVELKIVDSQSGELLKEIVTMISGETFRNLNDTPQQFSNLANEWVQQALKYSR